MEKRTNAGYDIIKSITLPDEEFVLGIKTTENKNTYVTWCCVDKVNYHYGHYIFYTQSFHLWCYCKT